VQQLDPDMGLEECDCATNGSRRPFEPPARASKAALVEGRDEDLHGINAIHHSLIMIIA
jgi:hypothetical protein